MEGPQGGWWARVEEKNTELGWELILQRWFKTRMVGQGLLGGISVSGAQGAKAGV